MESIKNILEVLSVSNQKAAEDQTSSTETNEPSRSSQPNHDEITVEADIHEQPEDISINSIEEFLPTDDAGTNLNCQLPTNQP